MTLEVIFLEPAGSRFRIMLRLDRRRQVVTLGR